MNDIFIHQSGWYRRREFIELLSLFIHILWVRGTGAFFVSQGNSSYETSPLRRAVLNYNNSLSLTKGVLSAMKLTPDCTEIEALAAKYPIIPVCREVFADIVTPITLLRKIAGRCV